MSTEPTTNETTEIGIQNLMNRFFTSEMPDDSNNRISADEQYAVETFKANLKFKDFNISNPSRKSAASSQLPISASAFL